jgi:hypothetical protein
MEADEADYAEADPPPRWLSDTLRLAAAARSWAVGCVWVVVGFAGIFGLAAGLGWVIQIVLAATR